MIVVNYTSNSVILEDRTYLTQGGSVDDSVDRIYMVEGGTMPTPGNPGQSGSSVEWGQIFPTGEFGNQS